MARPVAAEGRVIGALVDAGCEYVQIDLPANSRLDSTQRVARLRGFGHRLLLHFSADEGLFCYRFRCWFGH